MHIRLAKEINMKSIITISTILSLTGTAISIPSRDQSDSLTHLQARDVNCKGSGYCTKSASWVVDNVVRSIDRNKIYTTTEGYISYFLRPSRPFVYSKFV